ncbi:uncharacterized protein LOC121794014 [Salvia splendens]|uniref:uncharacterized protein LOC121794014 n=1 Tax=Salvia splendens TaxID=180675 RepID=UPI001C26C6DF|nr:uncharacterized protein LOC121794014 [Salvia splendens]
MGRKKMTVSFQLRDDAAKQDKASNASSETKTGVEKLLPQAKEAMNVEKNSRARTVVVRRSSRIKSLTPSTNSPELEHVPEHVDLVEEEKEQEPEVQPVGNLLVEEEQEQEVQPGSNPPDAHGGSLEEKVDYLVEAVDYLKFKVCKRDAMAVPSPDISYKSLYISSQKQIQMLIDEQHKLVKKLEFARGKIAAYEEMKVAVGGQKEFVLVSELAKATGVATASLSPKVDQKSSPSPPPEAVQKSGLPSPNVRKQSGQKRARC